MLASVLALGFPLTLIWAAVSDLRAMVIPNRICLIMAVCFFATALAQGLPLAELLAALTGAGLVLIACFALFALRAMGGGDAKLLTATALWFGHSAPLLTLMTNTALAGGLLALVLLILRKMAPAPGEGRWPLPASLIEAEKIPYGIAIALGGILAFPSSPLFPGSP